VQKYIDSSINTKFSASEKLAVGKQKCEQISKKQKKFTSSSTNLDFGDDRSPKKSKFDKENEENGNSVTKMPPDNHYHFDFSNSKILAPLNFGGIGNRIPDDLFSRSAAPLHIGAPVMMNYYGGGVSNNSLGYPSFAVPPPQLHYPNHGEGNINYGHLGGYNNCSSVPFHHYENLDEEETDFDVVQSYNLDFNNLGLLEEDNEEEESKMLN